MGKYHGDAGFDVCSHLKSVQIKIPIGCFPFNQRFPPYTESKYKFLLTLLKITDVN